MFYQCQRRTLRVSMVVLLFAAAESVAAQSTESYAVNETTPAVNEAAPTAVKKNIRPDIDAVNRKMNEEMIAAIKSEIAASPEDAALYNNLGAAYARAKNYEEAAAALEKAIALKPDFSNAYYNLSIVYDQLGRYDAALAQARKAVEFNAASASNRTELCQLYLSTQDFRASASCYEALFKMATPNSQIRAGYVAALISSGQSDKALLAASETVRLFPSDSLAHNSLGMALFLKKRYKQAVEFFSRAIELQADFYEARYNLGVAQTLVNDRAAAIKQYHLLKNLNSTYAESLYKFLYQDKIVYANK